MEAIKGIPYGMSNFTDVMEQNCYYVDKTMYLPLLEDQAHYFIFIRPRRFGKSLFLDMLRNIIQHRIQSYNDWCICFADIADQFVNHDSFSSWFLNTIFPSQMV